MARSILAIVLCHQLLVPVLAQSTAATPQPDPQKPPAQKPAQQNPDDTDVVKITTNLVQVDAVITDGKGKVVTDLGADEVEIFEDGKKQPITNFSFIPLESEPASPEKAEKPAEKTAAPTPIRRLRREDVRRTIALVIDDLGMSAESVHFVRRALRKFVEEDLKPNDLVAIIRTAGGIGVLQQFTSDKRELLAAVEKVRWNPSGRGELAPFASIVSEAPSEGDDRIDQSRDGSIDNLREDLFTVGTLGAVSYIIKGLKNLPGRKSVMLLSDGFSLYRFDNPGENVRVMAAVDRLIDTANRASVVIYTMHTTGLQTLNFDASDPGTTRPGQMMSVISARRAASFQSQDSLKFLADATGGISSRNTNDLLGGIRKAIEDQRGYYLIGYRPDDLTFSRDRGGHKFHRLSVKVRRPGKFNVRMRKGFYGIPDEESTPVAKTSQQRVMDALTSPFNSNGVEMRLTSLFLNDAKLGPVMQSFLHIKASDLTFTPEEDGWQKAVVELVAMTFGDNGLPVDQMSHTHTMRIRGPAYQNAIKNGIAYSINVPVNKPGGYQLRTVLRDTISERIGSASQYVEVPDIKKKRLILSGIVLRGIDANLYLSQKGDASKDTDANNSLAGAASRRFHHGLVMEYGLVAYNPQIDKATGKPNLAMQIRLFRDTKLVFTGKEVAADLGAITDPLRVAMGGALRLGTELEPGEYMLQVIVRDVLVKGKNSLATQWTDFQVTSARADQ